MTNFTTAQLATILSALVGKMRKPTNEVGAMRAIRHEAAAICGTGEAVPAFAPGPLEGWLDPTAWRNQLIAAAEPTGSDEQGELADRKKTQPPELDHITFRVGTKQALIAGLLGREQGATLDEIIAATRWLPRTSRAALTVLRQKGLGLEKSTREDGNTSYRVVPPDPIAAHVPMPNGRT